MTCDKCGKPMWVYFTRFIPWMNKIEKWCPICAGLGKIFGKKSKE